MTAPTAAAPTAPAPAGVPRFVEALLAARRPLIMEIKLRDPHGNDLLGTRSVADLVTAYQQAGAPCLSVVTGRWFGGTPRLLREVAAATDLPVLQKDFLTRPAQLEAAAALGASAVLLTAALLPATSLARLVTCALDLGLAPFVEITQESELAGLPQVERCVVAVNNKDIRTRERDPGDLSRSLRLLPALHAAGTPAPVSASAITDPNDAARLLGAGYRGLLIGTSLMRSGDLPAWLDAFDTARQAPARTAAGVEVARAQVGA
ncbi:indole-3-glycerol-phosphate synthase [Kitasatospora sp. NPDC097643]|uniref:indole-3-glycerol-phosphate synthase n=1 Tax=Kitasatospora sp. NPDC097643 TaxID=3157230 RepID=UPI00331A92C0